MRNRSTQKFRPGFSLMEMIVVIGLLALAGTIIVPLSKWSVTSLRAAQSHMTMASRFDLAISQLREDVWQAKKLDVPAANSVRVTLADGKNVTWKIGPGDQLSRDESRWTGLSIPANAILSADKTVVRMVIPPAGQSTGRTISLVSETIVLAGGQP